MSIRAEIKPILALAFPIMLSQVGHFTTGLIDTVVAGWDSPATLSGVGAGSSLFQMLLVVGIGVLLGLDTTVAQSEGQKRRQDGLAYLKAGLLMSLVVTVLGMASLMVMSTYYHLSGAHPEVVAATRPYLDVVVWSLGPVMVFSALQRYWQARGVASIITWIMVLTNLVNLVLDILLVKGFWIIPPMGAEGIALATLLTRTVSMLVLVVWTIRRFKTEAVQGFWRWPGSDYLKRLCGLGIPSGMQVFLEVGAFTIATQMVASLGHTVLGAHHIVLTACSFTFMFCLGLSGATAAHIGQLFGASRGLACWHSGWLTMALSVIMMGASSLVFIAIPEVIFGWFSQDVDILSLATGMAMLCAMFQVFDGIQIVITGALRGIGNTLGPLLTNLASHYLVGLPLGFYMAFYAGEGLWGIWLGLAVGLIVTSLLNLWLWIRAKPKFVL